MSFKPTQALLGEFGLGLGTQVVASQWIIFFFLKSWLDLDCMVSSRLGRAGMLQESQPYKHMFQSS